MSDLYLVLRRRLEDVRDWVELGTSVMLEARGRTGLSYESIARQLHVSSKTYERYEKRGRVPRQMLPEVAAVLNLEIERPAKTRVTVEEVDGRTVEQRLEVLEDLVGEVLDELRARPRSPEAKPQSEKGAQ